MLSSIIATFIILKCIKERKVDMVGKLFCSTGIMISLIVILALIAGTVVSYDIYAARHLKSEPAKVVLYEGPSGKKAATDRIITVDDKRVFVYDTAVNLNRSFDKDPKLSSTPVAYFDFSGTVEIKIKAPGIKIESVAVRPLSLGIKPKISGDTISFTVDKPSKLTIEINNDIKRAIHLFANSIESNPPSKDDPNVIYFGPGVHKAGRIPVKSNQTVYISGGAVVYGIIKAEKLENVKVAGHGIIDGSIYDRWKETMIPIDYRNCKNSSVEGVIFLNPAGWTINTYFSENIKIDDIKIVSARSNSDGITTQSCKNLTVTDSFVRSWDDSLVVKDYDGGNTKGITFDNVIVWTDLAQSCEIGYETRGESIEDVTFKNITVLHNFHKPVLSIHNGDNALVRNIHYENVTVEDAQMGEGDAGKDNFLIDLWIGVGPWTVSNERGSIKDVYFNNISVLGGKIPPSRIVGSDKEHLVENIKINNLKIKGKSIKDAKAGQFEVDEESTRGIDFGSKQ
jgi:hypothetical protein